jgi:outer membrane lipoprotein SlyB
MKSILTLITFAFLIFSCQSKPQPVAVKVSETDTAYAAWKANRLLDSIRELKAPAVVAAPALQTKTRTVYRTVETKSHTASSAGTNNTTVAEAPKKKGWSKTAKGAVIGGVAGAVGGAVINKRNPGAGAVIGGVLGAGTGAVIGNVLDKKDKRN